MRTWRQRFLGLVWLVFLGLVSLLATEALAVPITHQLTLVVTGTYNYGPGPNPIQIGHHYFGVFSVDSELLTRT